MARLPPRGSSVASPTKDRDEFKDILSALCPSHTFGDLTIDGLYDQIAQISGRWSSEQGRVEATPVAGVLKTMRRNLTEACQTLGGHETGFHTGLEIETVSTLSEYLARDPAVGSIKDAHALISSFRENAAKIAHAALAATADLEEQKAASGRPTLDWYDDFTALLLRIAELAGSRPRLAKDRVEGTRSGWLFEAAQALEAFLWDDMRSISPEACFKRIERSRKRLQQRRRQNPPGG